MSLFPDLPVSGDDVKLKLIRIIYYSRKQQNIMSAFSAKDLSVTYLSHKKRIKILGDLFCHSLNGGQLFHGALRMAAGLPSS